MKNFFIILFIIYIIYFINDKNLAENRKDISFRFLTRSFTFVSDDGVFSKNELDQGTRILLETILEDSLQEKVLDMGCGYGPVGILLKTFLFYFKVYSKFSPH